VTLEVRQGHGRARFVDPAFANVSTALDRVVDIAWKAYHESRRSPRKRKAGPAFADPDFELPIEWIDRHERIQRAERHVHSPRPK